MTQQILKPVYALVGPDSFLQIQALGEVMAAAGKGAQRVDVDGERADLASVLDEVRSFAMFAPTKVVVVNPADPFLTKHRERLEDYVSAPSDSGALVLRLESLPGNQRIYKAIAKRGQVVACTPPKDLTKWVNDRAGYHKIKLSPDAVRMLLDYIGDDLTRLDNELAKLALSVPSGEVKPTDIAAGTAFQREQEMSELVNAMAAGKVTDAVRRWRRLLQMDPASEFKAVFWLSSWVGNLRKAWALKKGGASPQSILQTLRIWPREMQQPFLDTAWGLGEDGVRRLVDLLAETDRQSKTGVGDMADNVERFLIEVNRYVRPAGR